MEIKVKKIKPPTVECFDPNDNSLGFLNEYEFTDLRSQIVKNKVNGFYCIFAGKKIDLNPNGSIEPNTKELFNILYDYYYEIAMNCFN